MTDHIGDGDGRIFVSRTAVTGEADRGYARGIHHAAHVIFARGVQKRTRAFHIGAVHLRGILYPQAIVGGDVKYDVAARNCFFQRRGVAQITGRSLSLEAFEILQVAGGANEQA